MIGQILSNGAVRIEFYPDRGERLLTKEGNKYTPCVGCGKVYVVSPHTIESVFYCRKCRINNVNGKGLYIDLEA